MSTTPTITIYVAIQPDANMKAMSSPSAVIAVHRYVGLRMGTPASESRYPVMG